MYYIGIRTLSWDMLLSNYGTFFQHYALRKVLKKENYIPFRVDDVTLKDILLWLLLPIRVLWKKAKWIFRDNTKQIFKSPLDIGTWRLSIKFLSDYISLIGMFIDKQIVGSDVSYIVGGDQVWLNSDPKNYLLNFRQAKNKISYAVSSDWKFMSRNTDWVSVLKKGLVNFSSISVREELGVDVVSKLIGRQSVSRVCDPVLFLSNEDITELAKECAIPKEYLFSYFVNQKVSNKELEKVIGDFAEANKVKIIHCSIQNNANRACSNYSPREFLYLLLNAKYIVTNSFHGIVFALICNKDFIFVRQDNYEGRDMNIRQKEYLHYFGLENRTLKFCSVEQFNQIFSMKIDWDIVNKKIVDFKSVSLNWLLKALKK